jgi:hypothetical protein
LGTLVGKRKQTILKKRWFDITRKTARSGSLSHQVGNSEPFIVER